MTTEERVKSLESELAMIKRLTRRLIIGSAFVLGMFTMFLAFQSMTGVANSQTGIDNEKVIQAKSFEVVDDKGRIRARLTVKELGGVLGLYDENGKPRAALSVIKDGPGLLLYDERGEGRASLTIIRRGPELIFRDEKGKIRTTIGVSQTETPDGKVTTYPESSLLLFDPEGNSIWSAP
ncbi:MAG: hypothetical protein WCU00_03040 [Candidatus Latescibacterota bacterium]